MTQSDLFPDGASASTPGLACHNCSTDGQRSPYLMTCYRLFLPSLCLTAVSLSGNICECDNAEMPRAENIYAIDSRLKDVRDVSYGPVACVPDAKIVNYLLRPAAYSKHKLPYKTGVSVKVEFWIQEITAISEMTNDFEMEMYINELWSDPKLKFDHLNACKANLSLDQATLVRVWTPNSCFVNSKTAEIHESPFSNVFLTLYENGTVWVNYRVRVRGPCSMDLVDFPMDTQSCRLKYQSFSYNNEEVRMRWNSRRKPVFALKQLHITDFTLKDITPAVIRRNYPAGMWDELIVTFVFERRYMCWLAFSLGPQAITPRTMIGVNALLSMIFHFGSIMRNLPRVSYIKAIDVWMLSSMMFVFLSLVELAIVGFKERTQGNRPTIQRIDNIAQLVFPAAFSIFNIAYWARYGMKVV